MVADWLPDALVFGGLASAKRHRAHRRVEMVADWLPDSLVFGGLASAERHNANRKVEIVAAWCPDSLVFCCLSQPRVPQSWDFDFSQVS